MESIPPMELSFLVKDFMLKQATQNTGLNVQEFLGTNKALQTGQGWAGE